MMTRKRSWSHRAWNKKDRRGRNIKGQWLYRREAEKKMSQRDLILIWPTGFLVSRKKKVSYKGKYQALFFGENLLLEIWNERRRSTEQRILGYDKEEQGLINATRFRPSVWVIILSVIIVDMFLRLKKKKTYHLLTSWCNLAIESR